MSIIWNLLFEENNNKKVFEEENKGIDVFSSLLELRNMADQFFFFNF